MARHRFFMLSPEILCAVGFDGFFKRVNPAFTETLGHADDAARRMGLIELIHDADQSIAREELDNLVSGKKTREFETRCVCASGEVKWLAWRAKSYPDDRVIYAAARDITAQRTADEQLRKYNIELKELSRVAQAATEAKSEFLANVSHELRTPMTAILTIADILKDGEWHDEQRAAINTLERNGQYLLTLINEVLDLSRIEAGKLAVEQINCSLPQILDDLQSLMEVRAQKKGLTLEMQVPGQLPQRIRTDPIRLQQVLINVVENAIKFTDAGGITINVSAESLRGHHRVAFEICDTGIGMSAQQIERVFQPFTQGDASTTRRFGGTGLGLAIARRLVELLGGEITVSSEVGVGSCFKLWIDAGHVDVASESYPRQPHTKPTASSGCPSPEQGDLADLAGLRVLLAEDYLDIRLPVKFILERAGAHVTVAENGQQAFDLTAESWRNKNCFDAVLMDMQMPLLDGYTATKMLRDAGYNRPIIAVTAHAMASDHAKCLEAGCDAYVAKPINLQQLTELIRGCVAQCDPSRPHSAPTQCQFGSQAASYPSPELMK